MPLKPWYKVIFPREDLRDNRPLDAAEFAVHLDQIRDGKAPSVYQDPKEFFARTFLTKSLSDLATEMLRRLSGEQTETSAVFNLTTQFGGGKTHALTLLYHLAQAGAKANSWPGVSGLLSRSGISTVPEAATAIFVGTEFDSIKGRGGNDGTPLRKTPWGEIAYQLGGDAGLEIVAEHEEKQIAPGGDVIRAMLPTDRPCLILMDELIIYMSRSRKSGMGAQLHSFLHGLSEVARNQNNVVLAVSAPASELEMTVEDQDDYKRLEKLLNRLGKPIMMSAETETSEIIRRRLFDWDTESVNQDGRVLLDRDAIATCSEFAAWVVANRQQLPNWFPIDNAQQAFESTYPFHPSVLSVFERKWQGLPQFQRTRGVLRVLALWVAKAYQAGYGGAHRDPLIGLGTAPLDDEKFRPAVFAQLGEQKLEVAVTTDICGTLNSHAVRLDNDATDDIKKSRLHRKVAIAIFFESNGGQDRSDGRGEATLGEIRLAVAEPGLDIGNVETVLETLTSTCYYLSIEKNRYHFSLSPNLNKILSDRRANIQTARIEERVRTEIQKAFEKTTGITLVFFPEKSSDIANQPVLTLAVLAPGYTISDEATGRLVEQWTREAGTSDRTFKSAIIWCVPDSTTQIYEEARKALAWKEIEDEAEELRLDARQQSELRENLGRAQRDLKEGVWRTYKNILLLAPDNTMRHIDLGLVHASSATSLTVPIVQRLRQSGEISETISPNYVVKNWPPAFTEWSTRGVRDAFYASPQLSRLLNASALQETIASGVRDGQLAYVGKTGSGEYVPFKYKEEMTASEVRIDDEYFIITKDTAEAYMAARAKPEQVAQPEPVTVDSGGSNNGTDVGHASDGSDSTTGGDSTETVIATKVRKLEWEGDIPAQKWSNFYMKVLTKFAVNKGLRISVHVEIVPPNGLSQQEVEEMKGALRELGMDDEVRMG